MKISDIREKSTDELMQLVSDSKKEMFEIRFKKAANKYENSADLGRANSRINDLRKTIARAKTIVTQKSKEVSKNA